MAAGIGSRYGGVKQIEPVGPNGEIIIDYALFDAHRAGFERVTFVLRKEIEEAFNERVGSAVENHFDVTYAFQSVDNLPEGFSLPADRKKPWGTAHAVLCAADAIDAPFAVVNADDFYGSQSFENLYTYLSRAGDSDGYYDYCMVGYRLANTLSEHGHVARGVCTPTPEGYLDTIVERTRIRRFDGNARYEDDDGTWKDIPGDTLVSMNMFGFTPSFVAELRDHFPAFLKDNAGNPKAEFFLPTVVNRLIEEKKARVKILPTHDRWIGVTYREDTPKVREAIHALVAEGAYPEKLWG
jgi:dTDP-glucose pyrophosphorylase